MAEKRKLVSFKDVSIQYLLGGVAAVQAIKDPVSPASYRRAIVALKKDGKTAEDLEAFYVELFGKNLGRGRGAPSVGEQRIYKAQQINVGGPFLRIPLDTMGVEKKDKLKVSFDEHKRIVISIA